MGIKRTLGGAEGAEEAIAIDLEGIASATRKQSTIRTFIFSGWLFISDLWVRVVKIVPGQKGI
jgi:hypothetical protein